MKKNTPYLLLILCCFILLFSACAEETGMQTAVFEMDENATTGYIWDVSQEGSGSFEVQKSVIDDVEDTASSEVLTGVGQRVRYTLVPQEAGEVTVTFTLARPWEGGETAHEATYVFEVNDAGTCTLTSEAQSMQEDGAELIIEGPLA